MSALVDKYKNILLNDGVIITETDTVPAIICNALSEKAVKKIYNIKQRSSKKPIAIFCSSIEMAEDYLHIDQANANVLKSLCPGPITLILDKLQNNNLAESLNLNNASIGLRIPNHKFLLTLIKHLEFPLAATSANISNLELDITKIKQTFSGLVDIIEIDENKKTNTTSSIFAINKGKVNMLRDGPVSQATVEDLITK